MSLRVTRWLIHHDYDAVEVTYEALSEIAHNNGRFIKYIELEKRPGTFADVYHVDAFGSTWYVKFYIEDGTIIQVWSCRWEGTNC